MKKVLVMLGILCCLFFAFSSCGGDTATDEVEDTESLMDQAQDAADDAADAAEEMADEASDAMEEITE